MNICSLGREFHSLGEIDFNSTRTILDFDAAFIDTAGLLEGQEQRPRAIEFRRDEFAEFLGLGRTIVVFTAPSPLAVVLPIQSLRLEAIAGNRVEFKGPDHLKSFWEAVRHDIQFLAYFGNVPGKPFLFVAETNKPVATLVKHDRGNILLLPMFRLREHTYECQQQDKGFVSAFRALNEQLAPKKRVFELPAWSTQYGWPRECQLRENLVALQAQSVEILNRITSTAGELEIEERLKILFTGKGDLLVDAVTTVFKELGAKADSGEPGRDDIVVEFEEKHAVVEVKGKKSSAAESDAAQLEKWVAGFKEEKGTDAKGILLVNAYCETPVADRTEPAFPHQMLKYSKQREHCLITTCQLLGLLLKARANPEERADLINGLFSTIGVYSQFADWATFLVSPSPK